LQRYRCRQCRRTFNDLAGTPLARLRLRAQWRDFLDTLLASRPVRAAEAALLKVIDTPSTTASAWRQIFVVLIVDITN
jgi:transposase-like protein